MSAASRPRLGEHATCSHASLSLVGSRDGLGATRTGGATRKDARAAGLRRRRGAAWPGPVGSTDKSRPLRRTYTSRPLRRSAVRSDFGTRPPRHPRRALRMLDALGRMPRRRVSCSGFSRKGPAGPSTARGRGRYRPLDSPNLTISPSQPHLKVTIFPSQASQHKSKSCGVARVCPAGPRDLASVSRTPCRTRAAQPAPTAGPAATVRLAGEARRSCDGEAGQRPPLGRGSRPASRPSAGPGQGRQRSSSRQRRRWLYIRLYREGAA